MQTVPPRLARLLDRLVTASRPVPVMELAKHCGVSRRTIFREIKDADPWLAAYELAVATKVGEGVYLAGDACALEQLRRALQSQALTRPVSAEERRLALMLGLLIEGDVQKLGSYARNFQVSGATVSNDLDQVEASLAVYDVQVVRRPGFGVAAVGQETALRQAIYAGLLEADQLGVRLQSMIGYPPPAVADGVNQLMTTRFEPHLMWATGESRDALAYLLMIVVDRLRAGRLDEQARLEAATELLPLADFIANSLELAFAIDLPEAERGRLAVYLAALRRSANYAEAPAASNLYLWKSLAYQLIEGFDPQMAPVLKVDDRLVDGLAMHLQSATVRMRARLELNDPLADEMARAFPDILAKSQQALAVLETVAGHVPASEASFLATHFGAAVMRLREHAPRRLRIGVVCGSGIGTSYFMASQLTQRLGNGVTVEICCLDEVADWQRYDLCVSSVPLPDMAIPVVNVTGLIEDDAITAIQECVADLGAPREADPSPAGVVPLGELCGNAITVLSDAQSLLNYFDVVTVEDDCDFDHLAKLAGYRFGQVEESGRQIYDDIIRREALSTQVIPALELVLLHARTSGATQPVFSLISPQSGRFTSAALQAARVCVVMLVPPQTSRDTLSLMGRLSTALLEDDRFRRAVQAAEKPVVRRGLENYIRSFLSSVLVF